MFCEFKQYDKYHVICRFCGRRLTGPADRYTDSIVCTETKGGPGTELKHKIDALLSWIGRDSIHCDKCKRLMVVMDHHGADWVLRNIDTLAQHISDNAKTLGVPVPVMAAKIMIKKACK